MKTKPEFRVCCKTLTLAALMTAGAAVAIITYPFSDWSALNRRSTDIIIARCTKTPNAIETQSDGTVRIHVGNVLDVDIDTFSVVRGRTNLGPARLISLSRLHQGEEYLIFSSYHDGAYQALERYRIVPLGSNFPTNMLTGMSPDEQVRALLRYRLEMLRREMEQAQEEKNRLEAGLRQRAEGGW